MERRTCCRGLLALGMSGLLAACGALEHASPAIPAIPADLGPRLAGKDQGALIGRLLVRGWAPDTPAGLTPGLTLRERDPAGAVAVASYFNPGYHRVAYAVFAGADAAGGEYARAAQALRDNSRGRATTSGADVTAATLLFYDDTGAGVVQVGPVLVRLIASGSNRAYFDALVAASITHLQRALLG